MQVMLVRLMSKGEYLIVPKGTKFTGPGKLGLKVDFSKLHFQINCLRSYTLMIRSENVEEV